MPQGINEEVFEDRHEDHSLNCLLVCGPELEIYYVSTKWSVKFLTTSITSYIRVTATFLEALYD